MRSNNVDNDAFPRLKMTEKKAVSVAVACIRDQMKKTAFDANMYRLYKWPTPHAERSYARHRMYITAIEKLNEMLITIGD